MCFRDTYKGEIKWPRLTMSSGYTEGPSLDKDIVSVPTIDNLGALNRASSISRVKIYNCCQHFL